MVRLVPEIGVVKKVLQFYMICSGSDSNIGRVDTVIFNCWIYFLNIAMDSICEVWGNISITPAVLKVYPA